MDNKIHLIDNLLQQLRSSLPVFKGDSAIWFANEIIKWVLKRTELINLYTTHSYITCNISNIRSNTTSIANTSVIHKRAYWAPGELVGAPIRYFRQMQYLTLLNVLPIIDQALSGAWVDCALDLH